MSVQIKKHYASLSEAIRAGAKLSPRGMRYTLLDRDGGTCAIGAGAMAIGLPTAEAEKGRVFLPSNATNHALRQMYPYLRTFVECSACGKAHDLLNAAAHLFDVKEWTREAIADWLESEEEKLGFVTLIEEVKESAQELVTV